MRQARSPFSEGERHGTGIGTIAHHHDIAGRRTTRPSGRGRLHARVGRGLAALALALAALTFGGVVSSTEAAAETRTLNMYYTHTKKSAKITFKKNGRYLKSGLSDANRFLADWRTKEQIKIDPRLLDTLWEVYQKSGSNKPIHVVSSYRSPKTNAMLRKTRGGQAKKSQHMVGRAIDFFIPGQSAEKMRSLGLQAQSGGVGYYPKSGFVHLDTGRVRHWPRMSRSQLVKVFPKGGTLHVPSDGKPLPGYKVAEADYKQRMANGGATALKGVRGRSGGGGGNILTALFGGGDDDAGADGGASVAEAPRIAQLPQRGPSVGERPGGRAATAASAPAIRAVDPADVAPLPDVDLPGTAGTVEDAIEEGAIEETVVASLPDIAPLPVFRPGELTPTARTQINDAIAANGAIAANDAIAANGAVAPTVPTIRPGSTAVASASAMPAPVLAYRELPEVAPTVRALAALERGEPFSEAPSAAAGAGEGTSELPSIIVPDDAEHPELTETALRLAFARSATQVADKRGELIARIESAGRPRAARAVPVARATALSVPEGRIAQIDRAKIDALAEALRRQAAGQ